MLNGSWIFMHNSVWENCDRDYRMRRVKIKKWMILVMWNLLAFSIPLASAAGSEWYVGASSGGSSFDGHAEDIELTLARENHVVTRMEGGGNGWRLFAGKQLHENLAIELAYTEMGKFSYDANIAFPPTTEYGEVEPKCWSLSAVGILPLSNHFSLLGKAGFCRWNDRAFAYEVGGPVYPSGSIGTDLTVGFGTKYEINKRLGVRAEWERFNKVVHKRNSVDMWLLSLQYGF